MSREEYMKQLSFLLQDIPENEREEALAYYEDYFEEAGEGQERQVAATLGSPEKVAAMIKEGLAGGNPDAGEYTESGYQDERFSEYNKVPQPRDSYKDRSAYDDAKDRFRDRMGREETPRSAGAVILIVILCIFAIPVGIPIIGALFGVIVSLIAAIFGIGITAAGLTFAGVVAGVVLIGVGIAQMFAGPALGLMMIGLGMLSLAVGILFLLACILIIGKFIPWAVRGIADLCGRLFRRGGRRA